MAGISLEDHKHKTAEPVRLQADPEQKPMVGPVDAPGSRPPRSVEELRDALGRRRPELTTRLARAATFLLSHPHDLAFASVKDLASQAGVSPTTFIRLAQEVGLPGFSHLRRLFQRRMLQDEEKTAVSSDVLSDVVQAVSHAVNWIDAVGDRSMLLRAVEVLTPADTIFLSGFGRLPATMFSLRQALNAFGVRHLVVDQVPGMVLEFAEIATPADAAVIAFAGSLDLETMSLVELLASRKVPIVSFGNGLNESAASRFSAYFDVADDPSSRFKLSIGGLCLATSLVRALVERRGSASD